MVACFLVLGTPRSGTSAVAGVLHHLGVRMGDELMAGDDDWNPGGYYQDARLDELLYAAAGYWPAWRGPGRYAATPEAAAVRALAAAWSARREDFGAKSGLLPYLLGEFLAGLSCGVEVIRTRRPAAESAASWSAREGVTLADGRALIQAVDAAVDGAMAAAGLRPSLEVEYGRLVADPDGQVRRVAELAGRPATAAAVAWIDPKLKRY